MPVSVTVNNRTEFRMAAWRDRNCEQAILYYAVTSYWRGVKTAVEDTDDGVWSESES